ncbi:hypothetical protein DFH09DRAFT_1360469 [Mycena vulgaris]|nr:hypothetical protein DFH09DRAFT_1360469 [Mycena vulgaris]
MSKFKTRDALEWSYEPFEGSSFVPDNFCPVQVLARACGEQYEKAPGVLQFALAGSEGSYAKNPNLIPSHNGFVDTVIKAYNEHHALVIRPDDVWLAVLSQFNFFVNANAELLRASFGTRHSLDLGAMARQMVGLIDKNVADPTLRAWALPTFTIPTETDTTVSAVLLMATLKAYFSYGFAGILCGIPRVTLLGEERYWVDVLGRLEKLKEYGVETIAWYHLLRPVIARIVAAFDAPDSEENREFWGKSATTQTAPDAMHAVTFWRTHAMYAPKDLVLDDTPYHRIECSEVASGYAEVDVTLDDNGEMFECVMVAGTIGTQVSSSGDRALSESGEGDTVSPAAGWWMFMKK